MERAKNSIFMCYNNKVKQAWESSSCEDDDHHYDHAHDHDHDHDDVDNDDFFYVDHDGMMMMAWPPRSYTCSFCKREFRSAQALGGHMNVHRRDRAQLRQLSQQISPNSSPNNNTTPNPSINLNLPPNNPNNTMIIVSPQTPPPKPANNFFSKKLVQPSSPKIAKHASPRDLITRKQFECFKRKNNLGDKQQEGHFGHFKRSVPGLIRLDLEMNINVGNHGVIKEDLDLELRLGYN